MRLPAVALWALLMSSLVFVAYSPDDVQGTPLGTITNATGKSLGLEDNAIGNGRVEIHPDDAQVAYVNQGNYIRAYRDSVSPSNLLGGFWVEDGGDVVLSDEEQGGEVLARGGRGSIVVLQEAIAWHKAISGSDGQLQKAKRRWYWKNAHPARPLVRLLEEAQARGALDGVTWDFTRTKDSDGNDWTSALFDEWEIPIGMDLLTLVASLREAGLHITMDGDLVLHAWESYDNDVSATVDLTKGDNIRESSERNISARVTKSNILVGGTTKDDGSMYRTSYDSAARTALGRRKEGYYSYPRTATAKILQNVGARKLRNWKKQFDGPVTVGIIDTTGRVAGVDFTVGDTVALNIPGKVVSDERVAGITFVENEVGEYWPIVDLGDFAHDQNGNYMGGDASGLNPCGCAGAGGSTGGGGAGGGNGSTGGGGTVPVDTTEYLVDDFAVTPDPGTPSLPAGTVGRHYVGGSSYGPTFEGLTESTSTNDSGWIHAVDSDGSNPATWWANPAGGWSEVHKMAADHLGVYAQLVASTGEYADGDPTRYNRNGIYAFTPSGTFRWQYLFGTYGDDPYNLGAAGGRVWTVGSDITLLVAESGYEVFSHANPLGGKTWWYATLGPTDDSVWAIASDGTIGLIDGTGLVDSWAGDSAALTDMNGAGFLIGVTDRNVIFTWGNNEPSETSLYRIDADGSTTPTWTKVATLPVDTENISVDPDTLEIFAIGGTNIATGWEAGYTAAGATKWGPNLNGIDPVGNWDQAAARGGVALAYGDGYDGADYGAALRVVNQSSGAAVVTNHYFGQDSTGGWAVTSGAVAYAQNTQAPYRVGTPATSDQQDVAAEDIIIPLPDGIEVGDVVVVVHAYVGYSSSPGHVWDWSAIGYNNNGGAWGGTPIGAMNVQSRMVDGTEGYTGSGDSIAMSAATADASTPATPSVLGQFWSYAFRLAGVADLGYPDNDFAWTGTFTTSDTDILTPSGSGYWNWFEDDDPCYYLTATVSDFNFTGSFTGLDQLFADTQAGTGFDAEILIGERVGTSGFQSNLGAGITYDPDGDQNHALITSAWRGTKSASQTNAPKHSGVGITESGAAASHDIVLPDGSNVVGQDIIILLLYNGASGAGADFPLGNGFQTIISGVQWTPYEYMVYWKKVDGTEGFTGSGDTITLTTDAGVQVAAIALLVDESTLDDIDWDYDYSHNQQSSVSDPVDGWWADASDTLMYSFIFSENAISGVPDGYSLIGDADTADLHIRAAQKTRGAFVYPQTELPSDAYSTTDPLHTYLLILRRQVGGAGEGVGEGGTPADMVLPGPDVTGSPYAGGNVYEDETTDAATAAVGSGKVTVTSSAYGKDWTKRLESPPGVVWDADEWTMRWKVSLDVAGDTGDLGQRYFEVSYNDNGYVVAWRLRLGDAVRATGVEVEGDTTAFAAKTLTLSTDYWFEVGLVNGVAKARLYSGERPDIATWDASADPADSDTITGLVLTALVGNDGAPAQTLTIDEWRGGLLGTSGSAVLNAFVAYGDGSTTAFSLPNGDAAETGTLGVTVDGSPVTPSTISTDGKSFVLSPAPYGDPSDPTAGAVIRASYVKA